MNSGCTLNKSCPRGYYRKDLEEIARNCGMTTEDIATKNMSKLCEAISKKEYFPDAKDLPCNITPRLCKSTKYSRQDISNLVNKCGVNMDHIPGYHTRPMLCQALHDAALPRAPCRLTKVCPGNYRKAELVRVAQNCGVSILHDDGSKKNRGELCVDILDHIDDQADIAQADIDFLKQEVDSLNFSGDTPTFQEDILDLGYGPNILQPGVIPPPPPLLPGKDITPDIINKLAEFKDIFYLIADTGFICLNDKTWLTCTRNLNDYPAAKRAISSLTTALENYNPTLQVDLSLIWKMQSKDGTLKYIIDNTECTHALGIKLLLLYTVWYTKLTQNGVSIHLPPFLTQVRDFNMFITGYISPDVMEPFSKPEENIFNIIYLESDPVQTYGEARLSISKSGLTGNEDVINRNIVQHITGTPKYWDNLNSVFGISFQEDEKQEAESRVMMDLIQPLQPALELIFGLTDDKPEELLEDIEIEEFDDDDDDDDIPLSQHRRVPVLESEFKVEEAPKGTNVTTDDIMNFFERTPPTPRPTAPPTPPPGIQMIPDTYFVEEDFALTTPGAEDVVIGAIHDDNVLATKQEGDRVVPEGMFQEDIPQPPPGFGYGRYPKTFDMLINPPTQPQHQPAPFAYVPTEMVKSSSGAAPQMQLGERAPPVFPQMMVQPPEDDADDLFIAGIPTDSDSDTDSDDDAWLAEVEAAVDSAPVMNDDKYFHVQEQAGNAEIIQSSFATFIAQHGNKESRELWTKGHKYIDDKLRLELAQAKLDRNTFANLPDYKNYIFNRVNDFYMTFFGNLRDEWEEFPQGKKHLRDLINIRLDI